MKSGLIHAGGLVRPEAGDAAERFTENTVHIAIDAAQSADDVIAELE